MDISLNTRDRDLKFEMCIHHIYTQGSVSPILFIGPSFYFIESRKLKLKKIPKVLFYIKQELRPELEKCDTLPSGAISCACA